MSKPAEKCAVCARDPKRMNSTFAECSHPDCSHRRKAWSDREPPVFKGPWPKNIDADPKPIDKELS